MYTFITLLIILDCVLLGAIVLIQNPKGGGLSASFGGVGQQLLGARRSTDVVEKLTWGFAVGLIVLCLSTAFFVDKRVSSKKDATKSEIENNLSKQPFQQTPPPVQQPVQTEPGPQPQPPAN